MHRLLFLGFLSIGFFARAYAVDETSNDAFQTVCVDLRAVKDIQTNFVEDKTLHILARPLHSKGTLIFSSSQGIYRVMEAPVHQELLITRAHFVQKNAQGVVQRMSVNRQPAARAFVNVFLSFFSGDQETWKKTFDVTFSGTVGDWQIGFVPHENNPAAKALRSIVLEGHEGILTAMILTEGNGDVTHTTYANPHPPLRPFPADLTPS